MGSIATPTVNLIDIRRDKTTSSLREIAKRALNPTDGSPPSLPTLLLYDEKGLKLFQDITYLDEYYLTNAEIDVLTKHADAMAARIPANVRLVELGSGNLRKVNILLQAFERAQKPVEYFALDLSYPELERTFAELDIMSYEYVSFNGLHGTYDDGLAWLGQPENQGKANCILSLGSSLGNFTRQEATEFLANFKDVLQPSDYIIVGLDSCLEPDRIFHAYNDREGVTKRFYENGLDHANEVLGKEGFNKADWSVSTLYNTQIQKHEASYQALADTNVAGAFMKRGDKVHLEDAHKYSDVHLDKLWRGAGLIADASYSNEEGDYNLHLLSPSSIQFASRPDEYAAHPIPSLPEWKQLWSAWDTVTRSMVPQKDLLSKPIKLRNSLIFYLGHIPTFTDIHYTRATGVEPIQPADFAKIFERGIDPGIVTRAQIRKTLTILDVDNPEICHDHSAIPAEWPTLHQILEYSFRVRQRVVDSFDTGLVAHNRKLGRALWLVYEHEAMHLETFLYMLLQNEHVLPPPGQTYPDFEALARDAASKRQKNQWHQIPPTKLAIGLDDPENDLPPERAFAWDIERPVRTADVPAFVAQSRPISNGEYLEFLKETKSTSMPATWVSKLDSSATAGKGDAAQIKIAGLEDLTKIAVKTVYGDVSLLHALDWPVVASYDELAAYAIWAGGRIPTFEETRSIYHYVATQKEAVADQVSSNLISAVNGHLINNGVAETPPSKHSLQKSGGAEQTALPDPKKHYIDLTGCNFGFRTWHPVPITGEGSRLRGQSDSGGVWEWTSSPLAEHEGYKPMDLYPGYSSDFFDTKHNICLGGSWATVPRIAGRKSFINWFQRNYPFTWATARLVKDVK